MKTLISQSDHNRVITDGIDVPAERPSFPIELSEVGIANKTVWVHLADQQGALPFTVEILLRLTKNKRGIHMSRIEHAITELYGQTFKDLREYVFLLGQKINNSQPSLKTVITINGKVPLLQSTPISNLISTDPIELAVKADFSKPGLNLPTNVMIGVGIHHITACPCTLAYNQTLFEISESQPTATHSQRTVTFLEVESDSTSSFSQPSYKDLFSCLTSTLHVAQDLLKRPDEAELVLKAHLKPQFIEDVVREIAKTVGQMFNNKIPGSSQIIISSRSMESIHIHDVVSRLEATLDDISDTIHTVTSVEE